MYAALHVQMCSKGIAVLEDKHRRLDTAFAAFCLLAYALNTQQQ